jgi:predicted membrane chloride channel (bestrophin family)
MAVAYLITDWIHINCAANIHTSKAAKLDGSVTQLIATQENMDRIVDTPIPTSYIAHINHVLFIFLLTLPFALLDDLGLSVVCSPLLICRELTHFIIQFPH